MYMSGCKGFRNENTHLSLFEGHVGNIDGCFGGGASLLFDKIRIHLTD